MHAELRNQTLVAAAAAKHEGFENTYAALIDLVKELDRPKDAATSPKEFSKA